MYDVKVVNSDGEKVYGPFETISEAQTEKDRWIATGGCSLIEIRPFKTPTEAMTPPPVTVEAEVPAESPPPVTVE